MHQDPDLVEALIAAKVQMGHSRRHPDLSDDPSATMYYVESLDLDAFKTLGCHASLLAMKI